MSAPPSSIAQPRSCASGSGVKGSGNTKEGPAYTIREMTEERLVILQR